MAKLTRRVKRWIGILLGIAVVAMLLAFGITERRKGTAAYFCEQCGTRLLVRCDDVAGSVSEARKERRLEDTDLSRWFKAHIGTNCVHNWHFNHTSDYRYLSFAGHRIWTIVGQSGSYPTPFIMSFSDDDRARVESLLRESSDSCRKFIHDRLQEKPEDGK